MLVAIVTNNIHRIKEIRAHAKIIRNRLTDNLGKMATTIPEHQSPRSPKWLLEQTMASPLLVQPFSLFYNPPLIQQCQSYLDPQCIQKEL